MRRENVGLWTIESDDSGVHLEHRNGAACSLAVAESVGQAERCDGVTVRVPARVLAAALRMESERPVAACGACGDIGWEHWSCDNCARGTYGGDWL